MKKNYRILIPFIVLMSFFTMNMNAQISGIVTVNSAVATGGTNYQTFNALASALNGAGINGTLVVNVLPTNGTGSYNEQVVINQVNGMSSTNTITINGNGNRLYFSANSSAPYTFVLNGTDYMSVNNLRMEGTNSSYAMVCILNAQADYNTFTACTFSCPANSTNYYTIPFAINNSMQYPSGNAPASFNSVSSCTMFSGYYGIFMEGLYNAPYTRNNSFTNCRITDWYYYAIDGYYTKNTTFKGCTIDRDTRTSLSSCYIVYGHYMQGLLFENNTVRSLFATNQTYNGSLYGFYSLGSYADQNNRNIIRNNIIRDIKFNGTTYLFRYCNNTYNDYTHNTISFDNTSSTSGTTYIWYYCYGGSNVIKNNIVTLTNAGSNTKYVYYSPSNSMGGTIDNNDYYLTGSNAYIGYISSQATTLSQWTSQGGDAVGYTSDPQYLNLAAGNLRPTNALINNLGTPLLLPYDNTNLPRSQTTPDMGALEFLSANCTSVSSVNSVITPTAPICPNTNADLMLGTWNSDIGITYQWLTSTSSSVGPWTPISGQNSVNYSTPNLNATTYYGVAVTCTNAVGSMTAAGTISIAATTISQVPYLETFEGISGVNKYPNCSWTSSGGLGGNCYTYVGSMNQNRAPHSGTKYAAFYGYYVTGANYFYTNGIQLYAGVTYSTALWYKTENYGYTNFTDLSIMLGTSQSSTGLVSLASTNGAASSALYTSISNTFNVSSSGIYYVAVRATSNGNYGAYYLSWDDLSITIPCNLAPNSPNVSMTVGSTTVCAGEELSLNATGADTYSWSTGDAGDNITNIPFTNTYYTVTGTNSLSGCSTSASQFVVVNPSPVVFAYTNKPVICVGESVNIQAMGAPSYVWSSQQTTPLITVSPTVTTTYTVSGTNSFNCSTSATQLITVNNKPNVSVTTSSPSNPDICKGESITLTGNGATTYQWAANTLFIQANQAVISPMATTTYTLFGTDVNGCVGSTTYVQNVNECLGLNEGKSLSGLKVYPNPTAGEFSIELNTTSVKTIEVTDVTGRVVSKINSSNEITNVNVSHLANGVYYVKVKSENASTVIKVVKQ